MRKIMIMLFILAAAIISGCTTEESKPESFTLPNEQGKDVPFENMEKPALVFFFTGIG